MTKYPINMHKNWYKFTKKKNKCDAIIKSTITKRTINGKKKVVETIKKFTKKETKLERERERVLTFSSWTTWKEYGRELEKK